MTNQDSPHLGLATLELIAVVWVVIILVRLFF